LPYTHFWHHYVQQHANNGGGSTLTFDPAAAFAAAVCLFLVACWAAYQIQARCGHCGAIPARCRCRLVRERGGPR
jgi:hypothetical protein